jgi:hypothetical protein
MHFFVPRWITSKEVISSPERGSMCVPLLTIPIWNWNLKCDQKKYYFKAGAFFLTGWTNRILINQWVYLLTGACQHQLGRYLKWLTNRILIDIMIYFLPANGEGESHTRKTWCAILETKAALKIHFKIIYSLSLQAHNFYPVPMSDNQKYKTRHLLYHIHVHDVYTCFFWFLACRT